MVALTEEPCAAGAAPACISRRPERGEGTQNIYSALELLARHYGDVELVEAERRPGAGGGVYSFELMRGETRLTALVDLQTGRIETRAA